MDKLKMNSYVDFNFGGKWLSSFGGIVGNNDEGFKTYPILPAMRDTFDHSLKQHGETLYYSTYEPRIFEVPVFFEDLSTIGLRQISAWLGSLESKPFYFKDEELAINCKLDQQSFEGMTITGRDVIIPLKFIAYDPLYYNMTPVKKTFTSVTSGTKYTCEDKSTVENTTVHIQIGCSGNLKIEVFDMNNNLLSTSNITGITGGVKIDCENVDCTLLSNAPHFHAIDDFPIFPKDGGSFKIAFTGTGMKNAVIEYTEKFI